MLPVRENLEEVLQPYQISVNMNERTGAGPMTFRHWHPYFELLHVYEGTAKQLAGEQTFSFRTGDTLLLPAGMVHTTDSVSDSCAIGVILFPMEQECSGYLLPAGSGADPEPLLQKIHREFALKEPGWRLTVQGLLYQVLGLLERFGTPLGSRLCSTGEGQELENYIRQNLTEDLSLQSVAAHAGYSPTYFSRYFPALMGKPFKVYVDELRMQAACGMLDDGVSTTQTAIALRYSTPSAFCRSFKRILGVSPSGYREQQKSDSNS